MVAQQESTPLRVLFLCTANSCRSQMAEGWAHALQATRVEAYSAGTQPSIVHPLAAQVMREAGVDLNSHHSKHLNQFIGQPFDYVVTLCADAREKCPVFPCAQKTVHIGFPDPAQVCGSPAEVLAEFRRVRDLIRAFVAGLPASLQQPTQEVAKS